MGYSGCQKYVVGAASTGVFFGNLDFSGKRQKEFLRMISFARGFPMRRTIAAFKSESPMYAAHRLKGDYCIKSMFEASLTGIYHSRIGIIAGFDRLIIIGGSPRLDHS